MSSQSKFPQTSKILCAALGAVMLSAVTIPAALAKTGYVAPRRAELRIKDVKCPGQARVTFVVWSRKAGAVHVALERRSKGILGTDVIQSTKPRKGAYRGNFTGTVPLDPSPTRATYRIIASGDGHTRRSGWVTLNGCTLSM